MDNKIRYVIHWFSTFLLWGRVSWIFLAFLFSSCVRACRFLPTHFSEYFLFSLSSFLCSPSHIPFYKHLQKFFLQNEIKNLQSWLAFPTITVLNNFIIQKISFFVRFTKKVLKNFDIVKFATNNLMSMLCFTPQTDNQHKWVHKNLWSSPLPLNLSSFVYTQIKTSVRQIRKLCRVVGGRFTLHIMHSLIKALVGYVVL